MSNLFLKYNISEKDLYALGLIETKKIREKMIQENSNISKFFKEFWDGKSKKQKWIIVIAVLFVFGFIGSVTDDKTSSSSSSSFSSSFSSSSSSYKAQIQCGWCGKSFNKGIGYINTPETSHLEYCSRSCAIRGWQRI